jgi:hypothetical protein
VRNRTIAVICATLGVGIVMAVATATMASAKPAGVGGLTQRIETAHVLAGAHTTTELQATCHEDELRSGGGYQVGSIGHEDKIFVNAPFEERGWLVEMINDTDFDIHLWAFAVCLSAVK